jgi:hypothetical protein
MVDNTICLTITEIDQYIVNARDVENAEVGCARRWIRTRCTAVTKLNAKSDVLKSDGVEKAAVPMLQLGSSTKAIHDIQ